MRSVVPRFFHSALLALLLTVPAAVSAQNSAGAPAWPFYSDTLSAVPADSVIRLSHEFLLPGSCDAAIGGFPLVQGLEYRTDDRHGLFFPDREILGKRRVHGDSTVRIVVRYQALPFTFRDAYRLHLPVRFVDSTTGRSMTVARPTEPFSLDDLFGANLQKSGSIVRGFTVGSNRDLSLTSGLRMQMSGNLTPDLSVVAALTDENSPLQPEGTTRTIQEVDKVFVELRSRNVSATLGDFPVEFGGNEFASVQRKLQGAMGTISGETDEASAAVTLVSATPRGKYASRQFQGSDGVQGPYRLTGQNNERLIVVIAATERVYIDGERMQRGESNDYTIDYSTAEITFTPHRLITNASRITVDFEYTDRQYDRTFFGARTEESVLSHRIDLQATFLREADDQNSPVDLSLADSDLALLRSAGGDPSKASRSGVTLAGAGQGQYVAIDTIVRIPGGTDSLVRIYRFDPVDSLHAVYSVTFQYVGPGAGDYAQISSVQYQFAGVRQGDFLPIRYLPMPTSHSLADVKLSGTVTPGLTVGGELAHSAFNANTFAATGSTTEGNAYTAFLAYSRPSVTIGGIQLGQVELRASDRRTDAAFQPLDRINAVEYNRTWNITDSSAGSEELRQGSLTVNPGDGLHAELSEGTLDHGTGFHAARTAAEFSSSSGGAPLGTYAIDDVTSRDDIHTMADDWIRQSLHLSPRFGKVTALLDGTNEILLAHDVGADTMYGSSYRLNELVPGLRIDSVAGMRIQFGYGLRFEDSAAAGSLARAFAVHTQTASWQLPFWNGLSSGLDLNIQQKRAEEFPGVRQGSEYSSIALRWQGQYRPSGRFIETDAFYEIMTERSSRLERVFQRVPVGTGNYVYAGDQNHNHVVDEADFEPVRFDGDFIAVTLPTDQLIPVIGLRTSTRFRMNGNALLPPHASWSGLIGLLSSETYLRVEEKSSDSVHSDIYLLKMSHFLNDHSTLDGTQMVTEDFYIGEHDPAVTLRFRFNERKSLTQYALGGERLYARDQSARLRWQILEEVANQTEFTISRSILHGDPGNPQTRDMRLSSLSMDWSYRSDQRIEWGLKFSTGRGSNYDTSEISLNDQSFRCVYAFNGRGQATAELSREEIFFLRGGGILPFDLTGGRVTGKSWLWHFGFDYRMTKFLQSSVMYDGRSEGGASPVHTAKAEVRAFF